MLGLKTLPVDWAGYGGRKVRVDADVGPMTIAVEGTVVGTAKVQDGKVAMAWIDQW